MGKELILVLTYCPNKERKEILFNFLKQLQKFRKSYDILVASHTPLDNNFFEYFDYFYYDKNNTLLYDFDLNNNFWFFINGCKTALSLKNLRMESTLL